MNNATDRNLRRKEIAKRAFDLVLVCVLLVLISPLFLSLLLLMLIDRLLARDFAPFFIFEKRTSRGAAFNLVKLNMYREAARLDYLRTSDKYREYGTYAFLQQDSDSISLTGRFIKKFYLDELGQLFNILRGDMSFVGPRPLPAGYASGELAPRREQKAGLVGLTATRWKNGEKVNPEESDLEYLEFYRTATVGALLRADISILIEALRAVFKGKGL